MFQHLVRIHQIIFAITLGFASVVEWAHMRHFQGQGDWAKTALTAIAAIASGYMASEALTGDWPSWEQGTMRPKVNWDQVLAEVQSA